MFNCRSITDYSNEEQGYFHFDVKLSAVTSKYDDKEKNQFAEATPGGELSMLITNPKAKDFFKPGKDYYLDFSKAE